MCPDQELLQSQIRDNPPLAIDLIVTRFRREKLTTKEKDKLRYLLLSSILTLAGDQAGSEMEAQEQVLMLLDRRDDYSNKG